ncbi:MAG: hypothetical protein DSZ09_02590, partial [Sulfurovum sp.]
TTTGTLNFAGSNFLPTSIVTIPGFDGTINSTTILSPTNFTLNVTSGTTAANYDIVVSNGGVLNTEWSGNGANLLLISDKDGTSQANAGETCKGILDDGYSTGDGTYWINPDGGGTSNAFQVYCDMTTSGGGWTKIEYSADFTHENHNNADVRIALAGNIHTPVYILRALFDRDELEIYQSMASNASIPLDILDMLKVDIRLQNALAKNPILIKGYETVLDYDKKAVQF